MSRITPKISKLNALKVVASTSLDCVLCLFKSSILWRVCVPISNSHKRFACWRELVLASRALLTPHWCHQGSRFQVDGSRATVPKQSRLIACNHRRAARRAGVSRWMHSLNRSSGGGCIVCVRPIDPHRPPNRRSSPSAAAAQTKTHTSS